MRKGGWSVIFVDEIPLINIVGGYTKPHILGNDNPLVRLSSPTPNRHVFLVKCSVPEVSNNFSEKRLHVAICLSTILYHR